MAAGTLQESGVGRHPTTRERVARPSRVQIERELEVLARWMDNQFRIPILGWRFGLNALIDLVPAVGDAATSIVALYIVVSAVRYRVPKITLLRMGLNIGVYFIAGLVPWAGDLFDAWWKPNIRNLKLLQRRATVSADDARKGKMSDWLFVGAFILPLIALAAGTAFVSIYLLILLAGQFSKGFGS